MLGAINRLISCNIEFIKWLNLALNYTSIDYDTAFESIDGTLVCIRNKAAEWAV